MQTGKSRCGKFPGLVLAAAAALCIGGCSGSDGRQGEPGVAGPAGPPGPSAPPGPAGALDVATARQVTGTITSVTGTPAKPTVNFRLVNEVGQPLKGLTASQISFGAAKLVPGADGGSSRWVSYINRNENAGGAGWGTQATRQATVVSASADAAPFKDNGDGTYSYTFGKELAAYTDANSPGPGPDVTFEPERTHRIGFEVRNFPFTSNPTYDYLPASGAVTNLPARRNVVDTDTCNACHDRLAFHGGGSRQTVEWCVVCHNPGTTDAQSGNTVDMKAMIHKIHMGVQLPTVRATGTTPNTTPAQGKGYTIWGNALSLHNFNTVRFTQDQRNCTTCHEESDADTPQASNWRTVANAESCGTCHDNVNFRTGDNHAGITATDAECGTCHGPTGIASLRVENVHQIPERVEARKFQYQVVRVTNGAPGQAPAVTIRVVDPSNNNRPYDITAPTSPFRTGSGALNVDIAWSTERPEFLNTGTPNTTPTPGQPIRIPFVSSGSIAGVTSNGDGTYTKVAPDPIPATATGSGIAILEGRPVVPIAGTPTSLDVQASALPFAITSATARARAQIVDIVKCNDCHNVVSAHGSNRVGNTDLCATCHNPNATDVSRRVAGTQCQAVTGTLDDEAIDFKYMIHSLHAGSDYKVCGFGNSGFDFSEVAYPGRLNNCEGCHRPNTYYPSTALVPVTKGVGADRTVLTDDVATTGQAATCSACHRGDLARTHMEQNGGRFEQPGLKQANGTATAAAAQETCEICHAQGRSADVRETHGVGTFRAD